MDVTPNLSGTPSSQANLMFGANSFNSPSAAISSLPPLSSFSLPALVNNDQINVSPSEVCLNDASLSISAKEGCHQETIDILGKIF